MLPENTRPPCHYKIIGGLEPPLPQTHTHTNTLTHTHTHTHTHTQRDTDTQRERESGDAPEKYTLLPFSLLPLRLLY